MINKYTSADNYKALTIRICKLTVEGYYGTEIYWYLSNKREFYLERAMIEYTVSKTNNLKGKQDYINAIKGNK